MDLEFIVKELNELNFTAIDLETANEQRNSICSIGLVWVRNGIISEKKKILVKPQEMRFSIVNKRIHGISEKDVADAPEFNEVWEDLYPGIKNQILLAHNASFDIDALKQTLSGYGIAKPQNQFICTHKLAQQVFQDLENYRLNDIAEYLGLHLIHHDSLSDATVCAEIGIRAIPLYDKKQFNFRNDELTSNIEKKNSIDQKQNYFEGFESKKIKSSLLKPNLENANPDNPFYNKKVVFTGDLKEISRQDAAVKVQSLGADINVSINKKTEIVIVGNKPGPSKMKKIEELNSSGCKIRLIDEKEFLSIINSEDAEKASKLPPKSL